MSKNIIQVDHELYDYIKTVSLREPEVLRRLREDTAEDPHAMMQISPDQGQFMGLLLKLMGAKRALEIGTFTGYSALAMALALPDAGRVITCDISPTWTEIARRYWFQAGVAQKIQLELRPALETLDHLLQQGEADSFDFIFIDADKTQYDAYYERALKLVRHGGLIALDNTLWDGAVIDPNKNDPDTQAIRLLNRKLHDDARVDISMVAIGDGLTLARRIGK